MADQGQWWKLWCSAEDDPDLMCLSNEDFGRWCKLGLLMKKHGTNGNLVIKKPAFALQQRFRVSGYQEVLEVLKQFPNCTYKEMQHPNVSSETILSVSFSNWYRYQGDISTDRVRKFRANETAKKRREEKRGDKKRRPSRKTPSNANTADGAGPPSLDYNESWAEEPWPSVRRFVALYNSSAPDEWPSAEGVPETRAKKIKEYLARFPQQAFWETVYAQAQESTFLKTYKNAGMDWLLQRGKTDGIENCLKTYEGKYTNGPEEAYRHK